MVKTIEISRQQVQDILDRLERREIKEEDYNILKSLVLTVKSINEELVKRNISIKRLRRLFAIRTEKSKDILPAAGKDKSGGKPPAGIKPDCGVAEKKKQKPKGYGRNGRDAYMNAETVFVPHERITLHTTSP